MLDPDAEAQYRARALCVAGDSPIFGISAASSIKVVPTLREDIVNWCLANGITCRYDLIGPPTREPVWDEMVWIVFTNPAHAVLFKMRWL